MYGNPLPYDEPQEHWSPEPIVAYRRHFDSLQGTRFDYTRAGCRHLDAWRRAQIVKHHDSPKWDCTCGYYGMKTAVGVEATHVAVALMYGIVIEHFWGYRAQYMEPAAVLTMADHCKCELCEDYPLRMMRRFQVPVVTNDTVLEYAVDRAKLKLSVKLEALPLRPPPHPQPSAHPDQQTSYSLFQPDPTIDPKNF